MTNRQLDGKRVVTGTISLILVILFFSGYFATAQGALRALDFNNILGTFGRMGTVTTPTHINIDPGYTGERDAEGLRGRPVPVQFGNRGASGQDDFRTVNFGSAAGNFQGVGGLGARNGFLFALSLFPAIMLALGTIKVVEHFGGLDVASAFLSPLMKPLMGIPGGTTVALIASLQSTDAGAALTKGLENSGSLTAKEKIIFCA